MNLPARRDGGLVVPAGRKRPDLFAYAFADLGPTTAKLYAGDWKRFLEWAGMPEQLDAFLDLPKEQAVLLVNDYMTHLGRARKSPSTRKRAQQAIVVVVKRLYLSDMASWTLGGLVRTPRVRSYKDVEGISHEDWLKVLDTARSDGTHRGARDVAVLLLLHDSALRRREVSTLDLEHLDRRHKRLWVWSKRMEEGDREAVPLNERQLVALQDWVKHRTTVPGPLFLATRLGRLKPEGVAYIVRYWCAKAQVKEVGPHQLRHAAITRLARSGEATPDELMNFARHTNFDMTKNYIATARGRVRELTEVLGDE